MVTLVKSLDRETLSSLEVVISVTGKWLVVDERPRKRVFKRPDPFSDETTDDSDTDTVSLRREINIVDVNDNPPVFLGRPYSFSVPENTQVGTIIYNNITVMDKDIGPNSDISMTCVQNNEPCVTFNLLTEKVSGHQA